MQHIKQIWQLRLAHYSSELQKYMRFIFTGHIAIVIVFLLGAGGYQYSEWLKVVTSDFPVAWVMGGILGFAIAWSHPVTLLKEPDAVYLLPLEEKMPSYFSAANQFTFFSKIMISIALYIAAIPLLKVVSPITIQMIWLGLGIVIVLKYLHVQIEFAYRYVTRGDLIWLDRLLRFIGSGFTVMTYLNGWYYVTVCLFLLQLVYLIWLKKKMYGLPVPYEHFITIEQNRMMRFYRFANYFTDVPHLRGAVRRRQWLDMSYRLVPYQQKKAQHYLVWRTFIRTNDHFYLWLRLTVISALVAAFVDITMVRFIMAGALAFATAIQLQQALTKAGAFRMDMLYPLPDLARKQAATSVVRLIIILQAVIVMVSHMWQPYFYITGIIIVTVGFVTQKMMK